jgi:hypothetical protein
MTNHFLRNPHKRPGILSNWIPTSKNARTFVQIPQKIFFFFENTPEVTGSSVEATGSSAEATGAVRTMEPAGLKRRKQPKINFFIFFQFLVFFQISLNFF